MPPKLTPLFHPESDKEANKVIQEAEDMEGAACMPELGAFMNLTGRWTGKRPKKPSGNGSGRRMAEEQAERDQHGGGQRRRPEGVARGSWLKLAWVNQEVSSGGYLGIRAF